MAQGYTPSNQGCGTANGVHDKTVDGELSTRHLQAYVTWVLLKLNWHIPKIVRVDEKEILIFNDGEDQLQNVLCELAGKVNSYIDSAEKGTEGMQFNFM